MTRQEFMQEYWRYYLMLEKKFIHTLSYVELATSNYKCYSNEYALLLQSIGAELDSFFKVYCGFDLDAQKTITDYARSILASASYPEIKTQNIDIPAYGLTITPFKNWEQNHPAKSLTWWKAFDKIKHRRTECKTEASQENVLQSLGALYLLEIKYLQNITLSTSEPDIPDEESSIFSLRNWEYNYTSLDGCFLNIADDGSAKIGGGGA